MAKLSAPIVADLCQSQHLQALVSLSASAPRLTTRQYAALADCIYASTFAFSQNWLKLAPAALQICPNDMKTDQFVKNGLFSYHMCRLRGDSTQRKMREAACIPADRDDDAGRARSAAFCLSPLVLPGQRFWLGNNLAGRKITAHRHSLRRATVDRSPLQTTLDVALAFQTHDERPRITAGA